MRTNFTHLREYPEYYELAVTAERQLLEAKNQTDFKMAGNAMRQIIEGMLQEVMRKYKGYAKDNLSGNFYGIKNAKIMEWDSLNNIETMRDYGNSCSHPHTYVTKREVILMYELLYEETYKMMTYYLTDKAIRAYKKEQERRRQENRVRYGLDQKPNTPVKASSDTSASSAKNVPAETAVSAQPQAINTPIVRPADPVVSVPRVAQSTPKKRKKFIGNLFTAAIWLVIIGFVVSVMMTI